MKPARRRPLFAFWLAVLILVGTVAGARPAAAQEAAGCQRDGGIYLYILYEGSVLAQGCTWGGNGYSRIQQVTSMAVTSSGFICQIAGLPANCENPTPATQVYWTYWWWQGAGWQYATVGGSYEGVAGTVEAWNYSAGAIPPLTPPAPAPPEPPPPPPPPATPPAEQPAPPPAPQPGQQPANQPAPGGTQTTQAAPEPVTQAPQPASQATEAPPAEATNATDRPDQATESASEEPDAQPSSESPRPADSRSTSPSAHPSSSAVATLPADPASGMPWTTIGTLSALGLGGAGYGLWYWRKRGI